MYTRAMLSLIPQILFLAPFTSTILRIGSGIAFMYAGYYMLTHRNEFTKIRLPIINHPALWMLWASGIITIIDGVALFLGYGTQLAAIVGLIIAIKHMSLSKQYESLRPLPRSTYALLSLMCLALLISGAGPFGLDLPL
jgi:uncharacterized membrane protein YphA (DoxX/SURF4 family)